MKQLTDRDERILLGLHRYRLLDSFMVEMLYFPPKDGKRTLRKKVQERLKFLRDEDLVEWLHQVDSWKGGKKAYAYCLTRKGARVVADLQGLEMHQVRYGYTKTTYTHDLEVTKLRVMFELSASLGHLELGQWITDSQYRKNPEIRRHCPYAVTKGKTDRIIPDGYCYVTLPNQPVPAHFFIESDRTGGMTVMRKKLQVYREFRKSGASKEHYGTVNFRVLVVVCKDKAFTNRIKSALDADMQRYTWLIRSHDLDIWHPETLLDPIWTVAGWEGKHALFTAQTA